MIDRPKRRTFTARLLAVVTSFSFIGVSGICIADGENLGRIESILETKELPYFSATGDFEDVIKNVDFALFTDQRVIAIAPRGLIRLKYENTERWFRAVHFEISGGKKIICPDMIVGKNESTREPVSHNMEGSCESSKQ